MSSKTKREKPEKKKISQEKDIKKSFSDAVNFALKRLEYPIEIKGEKLNLYAASGTTSYRTPVYNKIFVRDSFYTAFLLKDPNYLKEILKFCILTQGKRKNSVTGEEPGKIVHEYPEYWFGKRSTKYNSADTAPLFLIGFYMYYKLTKDKAFVKKNTESIEACLQYIFSHLENGIFWENPKASGAKKFALRATYWRDGGLIGRKNYRLLMPASYIMLQAQLVDGLRSAIKLLRTTMFSFKSFRTRKVFFKMTHRT